MIGTGTKSVPQGTGPNGLLTAEASGLQPLAEKQTLGIGDLNLSLRARAVPHQQRCFLQSMGARLGAKLKDLKFMTCKLLRYGLVLLLCSGFTLGAIAAPQAASHSVTLTWTPDTQPADVTIVSWNIYRSTISGGPYTELASEPVATLAYADTAVAAGQDYFYVLTSVDTAGVESTYSVPVEAAVPIAPLSVATTALPASLVGSTYSFTLSAAGGNPPYSWTGGGVPGLIVSPDGLIGGTLTQSGSFVFSLTVNDSTGATAGTSLPVVVTAPGTSHPRLLSPPVWFCTGPSTPRTPREM